MLTPIDEIANQNHLQLIKAAVAFLPPPSQRSLSLLIKLLELRNLSAFFRNKEVSMPAMSPLLHPFRKCSRKCAITAMVRSWS